MPGPAEEFHVSEEVVNLTVTLFVVGVEKEPNSSALRDLLQSSLDTGGGIWCFLDVKMAFWFRFPVDFVHGGGEAM